MLDIQIKIKVYFITDLVFQLYNWPVDRQIKKNMHFSHAVFVMAMLNLVHVKANHQNQQPSSSFSLQVTINFFPVTLPFDQFNLHNEESKGKKE